MTFTDSTIKAIHDAAKRHVGDDAVPGHVALVACGDEVHVETHGTLSIGGPPVARDSIFRIASTSKPITAVATLALIEEGLFALDQPIAGLIPELAEPRVLRRYDGPLEETVPAQRAITVRDLLTFTFGSGAITEMFIAKEPWPVMAAAVDLDLGIVGAPDLEHQPGPDEWMRRFGSLPLLDQPGERWHYGTGASVLGVLAARAAGIPFADVLRTRVFEPLGMSDTGFFTTETQRLATAYRPSRDGLVVWDEPDGIFSHPPRFGDGAAGIVSTADDLLAFARMFLRGGAGVISAASVEAMTTDQLTDAQRSQGGLGADFFDARGWSFCQAVYPDGSFGWDGGFGTCWRVDPRNQLTVVSLTQRMWETSSPPPVHTDLLAAARAAIG
ncbi:MAG TPA: serine hydrolase domain-containing protein [Solirubrobacteraceae bacterium]|jgi:CubicO group peptidase (beta-lactamase class C family)|nr:serine hydrolase domain-containing protein [Solirubrobacteraceae bacterium]